MKIIGYLMILIPVMLLYIIGGYTYYKTNSDEEIMIKGKCLETYTVDKWGKYGPSTTSVYTVVRLHQNVYIIEGPCNNGIKQIPWEVEHKALSIIGQTGEALIVVTFVVICLLILMWWVMVFIILTKYDKSKSFKENWKSIYKKGIKNEN